MSVVVSYALSVAAHIRSSWLVPFVIGVSVAAACTCLEPLPSHAHRQPNDPDATVRVLPPATPALRRAEGGVHPPEMVNPRDGTTLVLVPEGPFVMGTNDALQQGSVHAVEERPERALRLPSFYMARCEVTNAQYRRFSQATGRDAAGDWERYARLWGEQAPVVCVDWYDAVAYATWAGLRLPSEAEWEKAARGSSGMPYPWGWKWEPGRVVHAATGAEPVDGRPQGASPYGCLGMAGNVAEWCASTYRSYDGRVVTEERVLRGRTWDDNDPLDFMAFRRYRLRPVLWCYNIGFRCAWSP